MEILNTYYDEDLMSLSIDFSLPEDDGLYYRNIDLSFDLINYYSSNVVDIEDLEDIDDDFIIDIVENYLKNNDLPEQIML